MTMMTRTKWALSGLALASLVACSGGGGGSTNNTPPAKTIADRLDYTNPTGGSYTLIKNTTLSTGTHLVLDLMGPVGTQGTGVGFYLSADTTKVTWSKPAGTESILARNGVFDLGTAPQLATAKATFDSQSNQTQLQVGFYQKGTTKPPINFNATSVLASVALDLKSSIPVGSVVALSALSGKAVLSQGSGAPVSITITPGTVTAN